MTQAGTQVIKLGDVGTFLKGQGIRRTDVQDSGIPCLRYGEIYTKFDDYTDSLVSHVSPAVASTAVRLQKGDVVFAGSGETKAEIGKCTAWIGDGQAVVGGDTIVLRNHGQDPVYLASLLNADSVVKQKAARGQGDAVVHISARALGDIDVVLPPLEVQERVSRAIRDANSQISTLECLITKKNAIRQGMMQQLLIGEHRLSGFTAPWINIAAGDIGIFKGGSGFPLKHQGLTAGDYPFYKVSDMNRPDNGIFMRSANHYITELQRKLMSAVVIPKSSIVFAKVGAAVFLERKRILSERSCIDNNMAAFILDPTKADVRFIHYALTNFALSSLVATTALPSLNGSQLRTIPLKLPSDLNEQRAIAGVITDTDDELELLEMQLSKTKDIKKGITQALFSDYTLLEAAELSV